MGLGEGTYQYAITGAGIARAREALERSQYAGPAPVPLKTYNESILRQSKGRPTVISRNLQQALSDLVISERIFQRLGPAINSGTSIFLYGPPGNGKTTIARTIGGMVLRESMYIPYALFIDGQVVKLFDSVNHQLMRDEDSTPLGTGALRSGSRRDPLPPARITAITSSFISDPQFGRRALTMARFQPLYRLKGQRQQNRSPRLPVLRAEVAHLREIVAQPEGRPLL